VAIDDPQLTVRHVPGPSPVRVLFDPQLQLAPFATTARVFSDKAAPLLWLCDGRWASEASALVGASQVLAVPQLLQHDGTPVVAAAVAALHARGLRLLFVEGGGVTVSRFLAQQALDRLHLAVAPLIIGNGRPGLRVAGASRLADCPRPPFKVFPMGPDQMWDLDLAAAPARP
jgi:riboflavin biosynthesis pyrimidine reductase